MEENGKQAVLSSNIARMSTPCFGISLNGKKVRGTKPVTLESAILDDKKIAYSPKSYSVFDPNDMVLNEELFAWVEGDTLYLHGSSVSVVNNRLVVTTTKAHVERDILYLVK